MTVKVSSNHDDESDDHYTTSSKKVKEEVVTPLVELSQVTVVHQLLQQGHNEVSINGIVAQNGATTLQVTDDILMLSTVKMNPFYFSDR